MKQTIAVTIGILIGILPFTGLVISTIIAIVIIPALIGLFVKVK